VAAARDGQFETREIPRVVMEQAVGPPDDRPDIAMAVHDDEVSPI